MTLVRGRSRTDERGDFDIPIRVALVETDLDVFEAHQDRLIEEVVSVKRILIGMLVSITTASVLLAINVASGQV